MSQAFNVVVEAVKEFTKEQRHAWSDRILGKHVAAAIRANRESRGWSQSELGKRAGLKQSYIARLETPYGALHATTDTLCRIAAALDCALIVRLCSWGEWIEWVITPIGAAKSLHEDEGFLVGGEGAER